ncbi:hypothetical protein CXB51_000473 [Gossypium anomalum]|uniref:RNase H type-1 domain-containing protein n=1 Tax=Gossypium anomalum TaxID=47600 RepID=A0A8J5Z9S3_9ROSI|nr:hypothetical protein CXB51_000473 [Gossypium anomalum]
MGAVSGEHCLEFGESTDLLNDTWIPELGPLRNYMIGNTITILSMKVAKMVMNNGQWNWSRLEVLDFISVCHPPSEVLGNDCFLWKLNSSVANGDYTLCGCGNETALYVLCDCSFAKKLWTIQTISRPEEIIRRTDCFVVSIKESITKGDVMNGKWEEDIKWRSLSHGWIKINMDGSTSMIDNWSTVEGFIHDSLGNWNEGFIKHLGRCFIFNAELWAIFCGLEVAKLREYRKLIMESDCLEAVSALRISLGKKISTVKRYFQIVKFQFIQREGNMVANWIVRTCPRGESKLSIIDFPTFHVKKLLLEDKLGNSFVNDK